MGNIAKQFLLSAGTGNKRELDPVNAGAGSVVTKATYGLTASGVKRFVPEAEATNTAIPAAPATFSGVGWEMDAIVNADGIQFLDQAWSSSLVLDVTGETTGPNVTYTMIYFIAGAEIGRHSVSLGLFGGGTDATFGLTTAELNEAIISAVNPRLQIEIYVNVTLAAVSVGSTVHTIATNNTNSFVDPGDYAIRALRTVNPAGIGLITFARSLTLFRLISPAAIGLLVLHKSVRKLLSFTAIGLEATLKRVSKFIVLSGIGVSTTIKRINKLIGFTAIGAAVTSRGATLARTITAAGVGAVSFVRAFIGARTIAAGIVGHFKARADMPIERIPGGAQAPVEVVRGPALILVDGEPAVKVGGKLYTKT